MNDCSAVRSGVETPNQLNTAIAKSIVTAKATARQRHRSMACQIRRRTVSDIVGLSSYKTPRQSIEAAIDLSSIAQTEHFGALQRTRPCLLPWPYGSSLCTLVEVCQPSSILNYRFPRRLLVTPCQEHRSNIGFAGRCLKNIVMEGR